VNFVCGTSKSSADITRILGSQAHTAITSKVNVLGGLEQILGFLQQLQVERASPVAQLIPVADQTAIITVNQVIANLQAIPECHKQLVRLMTGVVSMLPIMKLASELGAIEVAKNREQVSIFIEFILEMSEHLIKYASPANSAFILKTWYDANQGEVDRLIEKSMRLNQNSNLVVIISIKEQLLLAYEQRMLDRIKPPAGSFFDYDPKNCCMLDTRVDLIEKLVSFATSEDPSQRLFVLSGPAGCGKSSVANSVAYTLRQCDCLLDSYFFQSAMVHVT